MVYPGTQVYKIFLLHAHLQSGGWDHHWPPYLEDVIISILGGLLITLDYSNPPIEDQIHHIRYKFEKATQKRLKVDHNIVILYEEYASTLRYLTLIIFAFSSTPNIVLRVM